MTDELFPDVGILLKKLGVTQRAFAEILGTNEETVSRWKSGATSPDGRMTRRMLAMASDANCLQECLGIDQRHAFLATLRHPDDLPSEGIRAVIDFKVKESSELDTVLTEILRNSEPPIHMRSLGELDNPEPTEAVAMVSVRDEEVLVQLSDALEKLASLSYCQISFGSRDPIEITPSLLAKFTPPSWENRVEARSIQPDSGHLERTGRKRN